jgi:hypothetical protein
MSEAVDRAEGRADSSSAAPAAGRESVAGRLRDAPSANGSSHHVQVVEIGARVAGNRVVTAGDEHDVAILHREARLVLGPRPYGTTAPGRPRNPLG